MSVSVLMPVYNTRSAELRQAIESILNQTYGDFEFIIINDGSTNDAEEVILSYEDDRIKYYKNVKNLKLIATLNKGIDLCSGQYIARLDADDYSFPTRLERQVEYMENHPDVGLLGTLFNVLPAIVPCDIPDNIDDIPVCVRYIPGCILHSSVMMRRSVLTDNKLYYNKGCLHAEDFKMWSDLSRVSDVAVLPEILTAYRISRDGICSQNRKWQNKILMVAALENIVKDFGNENMYPILLKFVKSEPVTQQEFETVHKLLEAVEKNLTQKLSKPYNLRVTKYLNAILKQFIVEPKIIWMNP